MTLLSRSPIRWSHSELRTCSAGTGFGVRRAVPGSRIGRTGRRRGQLLQMARTMASLDSHMTQHGRGVETRTGDPVLECRRGDLQPATGRIAHLNVQTRRLRRLRRPGLPGGPLPRRREGRSDLSLRPHHRHRVQYHPDLLRLHRNQLRYRGCPRSGGPDRSHRGRVPDGRRPRRGPARPLATGSIEPADAGGGTGASRRRLPRGRDVHPAVRIVASGGVGGLSSGIARSGDVPATFREAGIPA